MREFFIDSINKTINFNFEYDKALVEAMKDSDDSRWNPELKLWILPVNDFTKPRILYLVREYKFKQVAPPQEDEVEVDYSRSDIDYAYLQGLCDAKDFSYTPRNYQLESLGYAREKGSIINGDDVGLGKTFESIMYAETANAFPCLVIVPNSVKDQWKEKWEEITKEKREVATIVSKPLKRSPNNWNADVVVINYDIIGKKQGAGATVKFPELVDIPWKMVICDEAHFLKNKKSQRAKVMVKILKPEEIIIQFLTGTAISSRPDELWNLLLLIKKDHLIADGWFHYIRRYCGGYRGKFGWDTSGATNMLELNQLLRDNCYIRREKSEVLKELPKAIKTVFQLPISNRKEIEKATSDFIEYIKETQGDEKADKAMEAEHLVAIGVLRRLAIKGKLKAIEQYLKDWKTAGKSKLLVFGIHKEGLTYLAEKFQSKLIAGGVSSKEKFSIKNEWIENDETFLFANMESAGTGVDGFQEVCSDMLIIELPWRPSDLEQVVGRVERLGQAIPPNINYMLSDETIDKQMWSMLATKEQVAQGVNKGVDTVRRKSGLRDVIQKLLKE